MIFTLLSFFLRFFRLLVFFIWLETDRRQKPYELSQECLWYSSTREIPVYFVFCLSDTLLSWELWFGLPLFFEADILKSLKFAAHISLILKYQFLRSHCQKKYFWNSYISISPHSHSRNGDTTMSIITKFDVSCNPSYLFITTLNDRSY